MQKKSLLIIIALFAFSFRSFSQTEQIQYKGQTLQFTLPFLDYKVIKPNFDGIEQIIVKFPKIYSEEHSIYIIPNFSVIMEEIPEAMSYIDYVAYKVRDVQGMPGFNNTPSRDDFILDKIEGSIDYYFEYKDINNIIHSVYMLCKTSKNVGIYILFDCTFDVYSDQKAFLKSVIHSLKIIE